MSEETPKTLQKYLLGDKPIAKSMTMIGAAIIALGPVAESAGFIPPGSSTAVIQGLGVILAAFGFRRAQGGGN